MEEQKQVHDYMTKLVTKKGNIMTTIVKAHDTYEAVHECIAALSNDISFNGTIEVYRVCYCIPEVQLSALLYKSKLKF